MVLQLGAERRLQRLQLGEPARAAAAARDVAQQTLPPDKAQLSVDQRMEQGRGPVTLHVDSPWATSPWRNSPCRTGVPLAAQQRARPRQPRHHRADRYPDDGGDLAIGHLLDLAQQQHLPIFGGQVLDQAVEHAGVGRSQHQRFRVAAAPRPTSSRRDRPPPRPAVGDEDEPAGAVLLDPAQEGVAHDAEQPDPDVRAAAKRVEIAERAQIGVLQHVLGVGRVARQPAREIVGRVEMRQRQQLEAASRRSSCTAGRPRARATSLDRSQGVLFSAPKIFCAAGILRRLSAVMRLHGPGGRYRTEATTCASEMIDGDGHRPSRLSEVHGLGRDRRWSGPWPAACRARDLSRRRGAGGQPSGFSFVQISDSHIGFNKRGQPRRRRHPAGGARARSPRCRAAGVHDPYRRHHASLEARASSTPREQMIGKAPSSTRIYVPGEHDVLDDDGKQYLRALRQGRHTAPAGTASTRAACISSAW